MSKLDLDKAFGRKRGQKQVAEYILRNGLRITKEGGLFFKHIEIPHSSVARVLDVDRRLIKATIETIISDPRLKEVFTQLDSIVLLRDVAPAMGFGAIEIIPEDAASEGIIADVASVIANAKVSIRQISTDDPMFENAQMIIVTERPLERDLIDDILNLEDVKKVVVIN